MLTILDGLPELQRSRYAMTYSSDFIFLGPNTFLVTLF